MKYMLLVYMAEDAMNQEEREHCYADSAALCRDLAAKGQFLAASPLKPVATAKSVRIREGQRLVTDGPFAEVREHLGGYYLVDVPTEAEALSIAARIPPARKGTIEVRPVLDIGGLPTE